MAKTATPKPPPGAPPLKVAKACPGCGDLTHDELCVACRRKGGEKIEPRPSAAAREPADTDFRHVREALALDAADSPGTDDAPPKRVHPESGIPLCTGKGDTCENPAAGGVCWDCQQEARASAEAAKPIMPADQVKMIRSEMPVLRMEGGHFSDRLDGVLTSTQTRSLRDLTDGLRAKMATLASGRPVVSGLDAVKWWLESLARAG